MSEGEKEAKHANTDKVERENKKAVDKEEPVREGKPDTEISGDTGHLPDENRYPKKDLRRHQEEDQPEFSGPYSNQSRDESEEDAGK